MLQQAIGMVSAQLHLRPSDALARLRAHSFIGHRLLPEVAADVVARRLRFPPDT